MTKDKDTVLGRVDAVKTFLRTSPKVRHEGARQVMLQAICKAEFFAQFDVAHRNADLIGGTNAIIEVLTDAMVAANLGPGTREQYRDVIEVYVRNAGDPRFA